MTPFSSCLLQLQLCFDTKWCTLRSAQEQSCQVFPTFIILCNECHIYKYGFNGVNLCENTNKNHFNGTIETREEKKIYIQQELWTIQFLKHPRWTAADFLVACVSNVFVSSSCEDWWGSGCTFPLGCSGKPHSVLCICLTVRSCSLPHFSPAGLTACSSHIFASEITGWQCWARVERRVEVGRDEELWLHAHIVQ